jgi:hypothetical protein
MVRAVLRAGAWPEVASLTGVAVVAGDCAAAVPAAAVLLPVRFALLAAAGGRLYGSCGARRAWG